MEQHPLEKALKDLVDFLPATFATINIYFSEEITHGKWPAVSMNGIDWPSPAANLATVDSEVKSVLKSFNIHVPNSYSSGKAQLLPLPMAALVSLSITFNCEKNFKYLGAAVNRALSNCASRCPLSSAMSVIGALWIQKVCSFHDSIIFDCSRFPIMFSPFNTVPELTRSCFSFFLKNKICSINALLGDASPSSLPVAPGYLYLRTCHSFQDTNFLCTVILDLVVEWSTNVPYENTNLRNSSSSIARVRNAASLGVTLLCITGGQSLVHVLYMEVLPEALISKVCPASMLIGYSMAYFSILCGVFVWGLEVPSESEHAFVKHMDFIALVMEGKYKGGCDDTVWKAYVLCFVGLLVRLVPMWVKTVTKKTLCKLVNALKEMDETELAIQLIERGGLEMVAVSAEFVFRL